jgi:hypothetical protein
MYKQKIHGQEKLKFHKLDKNNLMEYSKNAIYFCCIHTMINSL